MHQKKSTFQITLPKFCIFLLIIVVVGCSPRDDVLNNETSVVQEAHSPQLTQGTTLTITGASTPTTPSPQINHTSVSPTLSNTPSTAEIPSLASTSDFETFHVFKFGAERLKNFWGDRLVVSPNGVWLAVNSVNQNDDRKWEEVSLYDYGTGQQQHVLQRTVSEETYMAMAFSPDSRWLAIAGTDRSIQIWDVSSGSLVSQFPFWGPVTDLAFSPDGQSVAVVSPSEDPKEQGAGVFDSQTGALIAQMRETEAISVMFLENGSQLLVGAHIGYHPDEKVGDALFIWDYEANTVSTVLSYYGEPWVMAIDKERKTIATAIERTLHLIDLQTLAEIGVENPEVTARALSFDDSGNVWVLDFDGVLSQWGMDGQFIRQHLFTGATDFAVIQQTNHLLIAFPQEIWEVGFQ